MSARGRAGHVMPRGHRAGAILFVCLGQVLVACSQPARSGSVQSPRAAEDPATTRSAPAPTQLLEQAEAALAAEEYPRAVALFGRFLARHPSPRRAKQAYLGLAEAQEGMRDCAAAIRAHEGFLERFPKDPEAARVHMRKGACQAELGRWAASATSYVAAREAGPLLPSAEVEALAREGYARFHLEQFQRADAVLAQADAVYRQAEDEGQERFTTYYFVGMARFYRAAIVHRRFRDIRIRLPKKAMEKAYARKLELLVQAQNAYEDTIRAKHMFWVSAAGFQMGRLFGEFYDSLMYAPVPEWLNERQRRTYYEELKKQLRPVIEKAVWVFEKNLETARRLGYESQFIEQSEAKLAHLRAIVLSDQASLGQPHPRLVPEVVEQVAPPEGQVAGAEPVPPAERKLFVPLPTTL